VVKINYNILAPVIDKLYERTFPKGTPNKEIEDYCEFIAQTIEEAGWDIEEWTHEFLMRSLPDLNPPTIDPKAN